MEPQTYRRCNRCIYDSRIPEIQFNAEGVCNYCIMIDELLWLYKTGLKEGEDELNHILKRIKEAGKGKQYDCVIGVSGGTDSSYLLYKAVSWGLRPLAVHYDNTWNTSIATENIRKILSHLKVDLFTYVVDNKESDDIFRSFFEASVPEIDGPTDIALAEVLYRAASKYKVKYILEGHSFMAEGVSPLGTFYVDGKYISDIHARFGRMRMKTFPNMTFISFMKWILLKRIKKIRPFWYLNYSKEEARDYLEKHFGWSYYGGHHLENRMTAFMHSYYLPVKFKNDQRNNSISAAIRSGKITREQGIEEYSRPPYIEPELVDYFKKRLGYSDSEFTSILHRPVKNYWDYRTYKKLFEDLRPLFYLLAKSNLVPMSFYVKYTSKKKR